MADKSCSEHIAGTMGAHWALSVDIDASGSFWGSLKSWLLARSARLLSRAPERSEGARRLTRRG